MKKLSAFILMSVVILYNCSDNPTPPENGAKTSPQTDIYWPSLSLDGWPMFHGNPQSTGRSKYHGPSEGVIENKIELYGIESGVAISESNVIYIGSNYHPGKFYGFDINGTELWSKFDSVYVESTPIITSNGNIIVGLRDNRLVCLSSEGIIQWEHTTKDRIANVGINIGKDGTIYYVDHSHNLTAVSGQGNFLWELNDQNFRANADGATAFSPDGKFLYIPGEAVSFSAVNIETKDVEWVFGSEELKSSPVVDNQGNIYAIIEKNSQNNDISIMSVSSLGYLNWEYKFKSISLFDNIEPAIDYDGNIYFGADSLYSVNYLGELRWKKGGLGTRIISSLICDKENKLYVFQSKALGENFIESYDQEGTLRWKLELFDERAIGASGGIATNGMLVIPSFRSMNLTIIK